MVRVLLLSIVIYLVWQGLERLASSREGGRAGQSGRGRAGGEPRSAEGVAARPSGTRLIACSHCGVYFDPGSEEASRVSDPPVCASCHKVRRPA